MSHVKNTLLSALFLFFSSTIPLSSATTELQEKLGSDNFEALKNPKFVTLLILVPKGKKQHHSLNSMHLSHEEIDRLKTNLLEDHNYEFDRIKKCHFKPEISFKFHGKNEKVIHVFVSPSCNQVLFGMDTYSILLNYDPVHERLEHFLLQLIKDTQNRNKEKGGFM